jgi:cardiolipin synthase A/B
MKYKLYTNSKKAWRAMIRDISRARKFIYIEMYIFIDDTSDEYDFVGVLKEKARKGLEVVMVLDFWGSSGLSREVIKELRDSGVELLFFSNWLRRTHRKILIVDEKIFFLGGVNIKKNSIDWIDLQIRIVSPRLSKNIFRSFAYTYEMSGGKNQRILKQRKRSILRTIKAQFLEHWPNYNIYALETYYKEKIISAKKKIIIVTPYLIPPRWLMVLLDNAVKKEVKVEIFIPKVTDIRVLNRINNLYASKLSEIGVKVYAQNKMNHAKILIIDNEETLIGSQNLDLVSFRLSIESGVFIKDKTLIDDLNQIIDNWRKDSKEMVISKKRFLLIDKFLLFLIRFFYSII